MGLAKAVACTTVNGMVTPPHPVRNIRHALA